MVALSPRARIRYNFARMGARRIVFGLILALFSALPLASQSDPEVLANVVVRFAGPNPLSLRSQEQIATDFQGRTFDKAWIPELERRVRDACMEEGYYTAEVHSEVEIIDSAAGREALVQIIVDDGEKYRLAQIRWRNVTALNPQDLRSLFPMQDGETFNAEKIREGFRALRRAYLAKGYINSTFVPDARINDANRTVSLEIVVDEGEVFKIRSIRVLGGDEATRQKFLTRLKVGDQFDLVLLEHIWDEVRRRFPKGREFDNTVETTQDNAKLAVDIIVDLRSLK